MLTLPTDSTERKNFPLWRGLWRYFPAALAGVAAHSKAGNDKHNPGEEMHHARGKSSDHEDCILRHLTDLGDMLAEVERTATATPLGIAQILGEADALAWRALALSQELHERFGAPLAPGAKLPQTMASTGHELMRRQCYAFAPGIRCAEDALPGTFYCRAHTPATEGYPAERCAVCHKQPCRCVLR